MVDIIRHKAIDDHLDSLGQVVIDNHLLRHHESSARHVHVVRLGLWQVFEKAHHVVTQVAHKPPEESWQSVYRCGTEAFHQIPKEGKWLGLEPGGLMIAAI